VASERTYRTSSGAAHRRRRRSRESEKRLRALGERTPHLQPDLLTDIAREQARRVGRRVLVIGILVLVLGLAGLQWFRPIPSPQFQSALSTSVRLAGSLPGLRWPPAGEAALSVEGAGSLGSAGGDTPVPIAGIAKVMTAYVVLQDHPLAVGDPGPEIPVTAATLAAAQSEKATQQSVVPVTAGESFTELQALEGLLVAQGNDIATLLTMWDVSSTAAFVAKMNAAARALGLHSTTFTDPSGLDPATVSTPADMIRLGEAAMALPVFRQIVAMPQVTLPLAGIVYNFNYDLGHEGNIGIKTGSDSAAGGCVLFAAQQNAGGASLTLVGAVFGQPGTSPLTSALYDADLLVRAAQGAIGPLPLVAPGHVAGRIVTPWGASVAVSAPLDATVVGWPGLVVPVRVQVNPLPSAIPSGGRIGTISFVLGAQHRDVPMRTLGSLPGPSVWWRLSRL
jgi:serine-type D-Ala-D-Ala carboxypeptidase (penicillin-binding protein 5/6)